MTEMPKQVETPVLKMRHFQNYNAKIRQSYLNNLKCDIHCPTDQSVIKTNYISGAIFSI